MNRASPTGNVRNPTATGILGERLIQKLEHLVFTLDEEEDLTIVDVSGRVRAAFDVEKVTTRRFYDRFKKEHQTFLGFIEGIGRPGRPRMVRLADAEPDDVHLLHPETRGFLDNNVDYLRDRLQKVRQQQGEGRFISFYRLFLLKLFHEGLGQPEADRDP